MNTTERIRLRKLGKFLLTVNKEQFEMAWYITPLYEGYIRSGPRAAKKRLSDCGTSACAIGWSAFLFPTLAAQVSYYDYLSARLFGIPFMSYDWMFLFSDRWAKYNNLPEFAARRISLFLEKGLPSKWHYTTPESEWEWS